MGEPERQYSQPTEAAEAKPVEQLRHQPGEHRSLRPPSRPSTPGPSPAGPSPAVSQPQGVQVAMQSRGQRSGIPRPSTAQSSMYVYDSQAPNFQQPTGYGQYVPYHWLQQQRMPNMQPQGQMHSRIPGQISPYGWSPYAFPYRGFDESAGHFDALPENQLPGQHVYPVSALYRGPPDFAGLSLGTSPGQSLRHPFPGVPMFPHVLPYAAGGRGRFQRPLEESQDSYDFDLAEANEQPEQARKTLMLRNIPNKYTIHMLLEMLDKCHRRPPNELTYDFCYLPIDFKNRCNLGYAFVNFVDAAAAAECYTAFHAKRWNDFNSKKVCEVKYARVQGKEALVEHFRNSKFPSNDTDCLPLLFELVQNEAGELVVKTVPLRSKQAR